MSDDKPIEILCRTKSKYHDIKIIEEYPIRKMLFGDGFGFCAEQSAINVEKPSEHVFDYSFLAMHSLLITPFPSKILVVGLGGGIIPTEMEKYASGATVDVIEIDPEVVRLAKEYFAFKESDRLKVYIGDAFDVVEELKGKYDMVIIDAFLSTYIPFHIMSAEFFQKIFHIMSEDGVASVNTANMHPSYCSQVNTIRNVFGEVLYSLDGHRNPGTTMLFALKKEKEIIRLHDRPLCHFLGIQPSRVQITDEIITAKIFSMRNMKIV